MGVRGSRATIDYIGRRFGLRGRRSIWGSSGLFCVAGAALGAPLARFAWQAQHLEHLHRGAQVRRRLIALGAASVCVAGAAIGAHPVRFAWHVEHLAPLWLVLCGRRSISSPSILFAWQVQHLEQFRLTQSVVLYVLGSVLFVNTILNIILLHIIIFLFLHTIILTIIVFLHHLLNVQCLREVSQASFDFISSRLTHAFPFA